MEVYYHTRLKAVRRYVSFQGTERLEPYLQQIDLAGIYRQTKKPPRTRDNFVNEVLHQAFPGGIEPRKADWVDRVIVFVKNMLCLK